MSNFFNSFAFPSLSFNEHSHTEYFGIFARDLNASSGRGILQCVTSDNPVKSGELPQ